MDIENRKGTVRTSRNEDTLRTVDGLAADILVSMGPEPDHPWNNSLELD